jgi:hypothetical protein
VHTLQQRPALQAVQVASNGHARDAKLLAQFRHRNRAIVSGMEELYDVAPSFLSQHGFALSVSNRVRRVGKRL